MPHADILGGRFEFQGCQAVLQVGQVHLSLRARLVAAHDGLEPEKGLKHGVQLSSARYARPTC